MAHQFKPKKIWVCGHTGMVGQALCRYFKAQNILVLNVTRNQLDLRSQDGVLSWLKHNKPDSIIVAAGTVGGIQANIDRPADFLYDNLMIACNVIHAAARQNIEKLVYIGSSCIYPLTASQPYQEDDLLSGSFEPTNQYYALAKVAGIKLCESYKAQYGHNFVSCLPTNLYGPGDRYMGKHAHVPAALIERFHLAKINNWESVDVWGTGKPKRDFLYVDDLASAIFKILELYDDKTPINIGTGRDVSIKEFACCLKDVIGYEGKLVFDSAKPDGVACKSLDVTKISQLGWGPRTSLNDGLQKAYQDYLNRYDN